MGPKEDAKGWARRAKERRRAGGPAAAWAAEPRGEWDGACARQSSQPNILPKLLKEFIVTQLAVASLVNLRQACFLLFPHLSGLISKVPNANGILEEKKMLILK